MQNTKIELLPDLAGLPEALRAELNAVGRTRSFPAGQTVAVAGTTPEFIGFVRRGILRMVHRQSDGREIIVGFLGAGDIFGRLPDGVLHYDKEAATDAEIHLFPRRRFEALLATWPELERLFASKLSHELEHAREWMVLLSKQKISERLAAFLLALCCRWENLANVVRIENGRPLIHVSISRADLASFLGTSPETISRTLHALQDQGLIAIRTPRDIEVLKFGAMVELGGAADLLGEEDLANLRGRLGRN